MPVRVVEMEPVSKRGCDVMVWRCDLDEESQRDYDVDVDVG